jgi:hypothetical protein
MFLSLIQKLFFHPRCQPAAVIMLSKLCNHNSVYTLYGKSYHYSLSEDVSVIIGLKNPLGYLSPCVFIIVNCSCNSVTSNASYDILHKHKRIEILTSRNTTVCIRSSPFSMTSFNAPGRILQNSVTNSPPLRLLFCRISFARYSRGICCSLVASRTCISHVSTTRRAFFRWKMHQWERAIWRTIKKGKLRLHLFRKQSSMHIFTSWLKYQAFVLSMLCCELFNFLSFSAKIWLLNALFILLK